MKRSCLWVYVLLFLAVAGLAIQQHRKARALRTELATTTTELLQLQKQQALNASIAPERVWVDAPQANPESPADNGLEQPADDSARIKDLELRLQAREQELAAIRNSTPTQTPETPRAQRSWQNWEETMRTNDPERYKEMVRQREAVHTEAQRSFAEKANHFLRQDTNSMTEEEFLSHEEALALLDQTWKLAEQLQSGVDRGQRWEIIRQMRDNVSALEPAMETERERQWYILADELGYTNDDAATFVNYLDNIVNVTSMQDINQILRRGRGGRGRPAATNSPATSTP